MSSYLEERIEWYDHNYRMGNPLITDDQFDQLEANLYRVNPNANYFTNKKLLPLPSLPKDQIEEFIEGLLPDTRLIIEPKIDGCAIALQYRDGILEKQFLEKAVMLLTKIKAIPDVPSNIKVQRFILLEENFLTLQNMKDQLILKDRRGDILGLLIAKAITLAVALSR